MKTNRPTDERSYKKWKRIIESNEAEEAHRKDVEDNCSSSVGNKYNGPPDWDTIFRHAHALAPVEYKMKTRSLRNKHRKQFNPPQKYQLLKLGSFTPVALAKIFYHINFMAKQADVAAAPEEMFFTELTNSFIDGSVIRLCVSLGPINSISGDRLNGCHFCRNYNNVWHPKGGFVRGYDTCYKTLQDICDINLKNAIPDREKHLPVREFVTGSFFSSTDSKRLLWSAGSLTYVSITISEHWRSRLKQVSGSPELKREGEYISEQVDDASLYATEALKFYNQISHCNYELVKPGFATRVILPKCTLFHVNFKAKETVSIAPEKLFFAELTSSGGVFSVKCSLALSPSDIELGDETGDKTNGCYYCHEFNKVRHPLCGRFVRGGDSLYTQLT